VKESLGPQNWEVAQAKVRQMETATFFPNEEKPKITIEDETNKFFADCRARMLLAATIKYDVPLIEATKDLR
jgi:hypothetical protein